MKKLIAVIFIVILAMSCAAQSSTVYQKTLDEKSWPNGWGPAMPYHVKVISDTFWYDIHWDGKTIFIKSSVERNYAEWTDDEWRNLINYCYVDNDNLKMIKL
jgi:hypothetical protein